MAGPPKAVSVSATGGTLFGVSYQLWMAGAASGAGPVGAVLGALSDVAALVAKGKTAALQLVCGKAGLESGLRCDWNVERQIGSTPDTAQIQVYNLDPAIRASLSSATALRPWTPVELYCGWGNGAPGLLFGGQVRKFLPARKTGVDILTIIEADNGTRQLSEVPAGGGSAVGATWARVVEEIIRPMNLTASPAALAAIAEAAADVPLPTFNFVASGEGRDLLDVIMATLKLQWGIDGDRFVVYRDGFRRDLLPAILTPLTGLLSWEVLDDGGVAFEALALPTVAPGGLVTISESTKPGVIEPVGEGQLRVERVSFRGSSEGESIMTGVARRVLVL